MSVFRGVLVPGPEIKPTAPALEVRNWDKWKYEAESMFYGQKFKKINKKYQSTDHRVYQMPSNRLQVE